MKTKLLTRRAAWERVAARFGLHIPPVERGSTLEWGRHYLPDYYQDSASLMHRFISNTVDDQFSRRGQKSVVIGPRGGAKSTVGNLTYGLKKICEGDEPYILLVSDTETQAIDSLSNIKTELETNDKIAEDYPHVFGQGPVWKENYIRTRHGVVVHAVGTGTKIRGRRRRQNRPSLIICDDIENDDHITSSNERNRVEVWFNRTLRNMGDTRTNILVLGSALHRESLLMRLMRRAGWIVRRVNGRPSPFKAIEQFPTRMDLWAEWERIFNDVDNPNAERDARKFYKIRKKEMDKGAVLCWPDHEPLYGLMVLRAEIGHASFDAEKQGNPLDPTTCEWPENYFNNDDLYFDEWPENLLVKGMALDPSKGKKDNRHDYQAIAWGGLTSNGVLYVDLDLGKRPIEELVVDCLGIFDDFRPEAFGVETNQFQELLADIINEAAEEAGLGVEVTPMENWTNKIVRIRRLGTLFKKKRIKFKRGSEGVEIALQQTRDFPNGDHDDGPDAIEMLCRLLFSLLEDSGEEEASEQISKLMKAFQ